MADPSGPGEWRVRAVLAGAGLVLALAFGEVAARTLRVDTRSVGRIFKITNGPSLVYPGRGGHILIDLYDSNPRGYFPVDLTREATRRDLIDLGFGRVAEAAGHHPFGVPVHYNERGFRDRTFAPKPEGVRRVVFVGDSFTEGQGVRDGDTLVRALEPRLQAPGVRVETWNLGIRAHDLPEIADRVRDAVELRADVVVYAMVLNDGERDPGLAARWPRVNDAIMVRESERPPLADASRLFGFFWTRFERLKTSRETIAWYREIYSEANRDGWLRTRGDLLRMRAEAERSGAAFGVALWPLMVGLESVDVYPFLDAHEQIRQGCERASIPFVDLLPALLGRRSSDYWVHESDLHPNEVANARAAGQLQNFVSGLLRSR